MSSILAVSAGRAKQNNLEVRPFLLIHNFGAHVGACSKTRMEDGRNRSRPFLRQFGPDGWNIDDSGHPGFAGRRFEWCAGERLQILVQNAVGLADSCCPQTSLANKAQDGFRVQFQTPCCEMNGAQLSRRPKLRFPSRSFFARPCFGFETGELIAWGIK